MWKKETRGPWWPWSSSPELSGLCSIAFKSRDLNHNPLVTSIRSSIIWPCPIFKHLQDSSRQTLWPSFMSIRPKIWSLNHTRGISKIWPSDLGFDRTWFIFKLVRNFIKTKVLIKFQDYLTENVALERTKGFSKIWASDLDFDPAWPIFKFVWDVIETNMLIKFHDYQAENVASRACIRFF